MTPTDGEPRVLSSDSFADTKLMTSDFGDHQVVAALVKLNVFIFTFECLQNLDLNEEIVLLK